MSPPITMRIAERHDALCAARRARGLARTRRMSATSSEHVAIIVSELATNIARYSNGGHLTVAADEQGVRIEARDMGPPIEDFACALLDGSGPNGPIELGAAGRQFHTASGLGAVSRLSSTLEHNVEAGGNVIIARVCAPRGSW